MGRAKYETFKGNHIMKVTVIGAGGKMGCRLTRNLKNSQYEMSYVEISDKGIQNLKELGVETTDALHAIPAADVVILAVPDTALGKVSEQVIPQMQAGSMVVFLDPAVAMAG